MCASTSMSSESRIRSPWIAGERTMQTARHSSPISVMSSTISVSTILLRSVLRAVPKLSGSDLRHSGQSRLLRGPEHPAGSGATEDIPSQLLRRPSRHHVRGRLAASHCHDPAGRLFHARCAIVRIIGLFSNALEDHALISSQGDHWAGVPNFQLDFLTAQLQRIKREN